METRSEVVEEARQAGYTEEQLDALKRVTDMIVGYYDDQLRKACDWGLISAETFVCYMGRAPKTGLYKTYPPIPRSLVSHTSEGFFSTLMNSNQEAILNSFKKTLEVSKHLQRRSESKENNIISLVLFDLPRVMFGEMFLADEKGNILLNYLPQAKTRDGARCCHLSQAFSTWIYGEIIKNNAEARETAGVSVSEVYDMHKRLYGESALYGYYLTYFETMFNKEDHYPHPLAVMMVYGREILRVIFDDDDLAEACIDKWDADTSKVASLPKIICVSKFVLDVIYKYAREA